MSEQLPIITAVDGGTFVIKYDDGTEQTYHFGVCDNPICPPFAFMCGGAPPKMCPYCGAKRKDVHKHHN